MLERLNPQPACPSRLHQQILKQRHPDSADYSFRAGNRLSLWAGLIAFARDPGTIVIGVLEGTMSAWPVYDR